MKETVLWTNPSPTSIFNAQTVSLSDSKMNYDFIKIYWRLSTTNASESFIMVDPTTIPLDLTVGLPMAISARLTNNGSVSGRIIVSNTDTSMLIAASILRNSTQGDNTTAIPTKITGCKL